MSPHESPIPVRSVRLVLKTDMVVSVVMKQPVRIIAPPRSLQRAKVSTQTMPQEAAHTHRHDMESRPMWISMFRALAARLLNHAEVECTTPQSGRLSRKAQRLFLRGRDSELPRSG